MSGALQTPDVWALRTGATAIATFSRPYIRRWRKGGWHPPVEAAMTSWARSRFGLRGCCRGHGIEDRHVRLGCGETQLARGRSRAERALTPHLRCELGWQSEDASDATEVVGGGPTTCGRNKRRRNPKRQGDAGCENTRAGRLRQAATPRWRDPIILPDPGTLAGIARTVARCCEGSAEPRAKSGTCAAARGCNAGGFAGCRRWQSATGAR